MWLGTCVCFLWLAGSIVIYEPSTIFEASEVTNAISEGMALRVNERDVNVYYYPNKTLSQSRATASAFTACQEAE